MSLLLLCWTQTFPLQTTLQVGLRSATGGRMCEAAWAHVPSYLASTACTSAYACSSSSASIKFSCMLNRFNMGNSFINCSNTKCTRVTLLLISTQKVRQNDWWAARSCLFQAVETTGRSKWNAVFFTHTVFFPFVAEVSFSFWNFVQTVETRNNGDCKLHQIRHGNILRLKLCVGTHGNSFFTFTDIHLPLTSRIILTASLVLPSFRKHMASRRFMYTSTFVSRPDRMKKTPVNGSLFWITQVVGESYVVQICYGMRTPLSRVSNWYQLHLTASWGGTLCSTRSFRANLLWCASCTEFWCCVCCVFLYCISAYLYACFSIFSDCNGKANHVDAVPF